MELHDTPLARMDVADVELAANAQTADDYSLFDSLIVVATRWRLIAKVTLAFALTSVVVSLLLPVKYTAVTKILPPKNDQTISSLIRGTQLGPLASLASGGSPFSMKDPNDMYVAMLKSRTIAETIINHFDLMRVYKKKNMTFAARALKEASDISAGQDSIITVEVEDRDPNRAAGIANLYVSEFSKLMLNVVNRDASERRMYLAGQLEEVKAGLSQAEGDLRALQERTGMIALNDQAKAIIDSVARLKARIAATQVQLEGMRSFATPQNPDVIRLQAELRSMRQQLGEAQKTAPMGDGNIQVPTGKIPSVGVEYTNKLRAVKYHEELLGILAKQYELARLDEANSTSAIQVLDPAEPPQIKSSPKRALIVLLCTMLGGFIGLAIAFASEYVDNMASHPEGMARLQRLRAVLFEVRPRFRSL